MREQVRKVQDAVALDRTHIADRQQPRQPPPAIARRGIGDDVGRAIAEHQPRANNEPEIRRRQALRGGLGFKIAQRHMRTHHPRNGVAIRNANSAKAQRIGALYHVCGT